MIVQLHHPTPPDTLQEAEAFLLALDLKCRTVITPDSTLFVVYAGQLPDPRRIRQCPGVKDVHHISDNFKLVSSQWKQGRSTVHVGEVPFGPDDFHMIMGPCSVGRCHPAVRVVLEARRHERDESSHPGCCDLPRGESDTAGYPQVPVVQVDTGAALESGKRAKCEESPSS